MRSHSPEDSPKHTRETSPELSVILPTDSVDTVSLVLERLREQSAVNSLEIVLLVPDARVAETQVDRGNFAAIQVIGVPSLSPLGAVRAAGVRAATAPLVFVGETHSYFQPASTEKLIAAAPGYVGVAPGFVNANPTNVYSWAGFLADYGRWNASLPPGEITEVPLYNALYRRDVLVALGDRLDNMLWHGDQLRLALQAGGHRVYFEPTAQIDHANINSPWRCIHEHFLAGRRIGAQRSERWNWARRLVYAAAWWLIPLVLLRRMLPGVRTATRSLQVPPATIPLIFVFTVARAAGEMTSYLIGGSLEQAEAMDHYEIRKLDYIS